MSPEGAYKWVEITTDDRTLTPDQTPDHLDALREVIAHPGPDDMVTATTGGTGAQGTAAAALAATSTAPGRRASPRPSSTRCSRASPPRSAPTSSSSGTSSTRSASGAPTSSPASPATTPRTARAAPCTPADSWTGNGWFPESFGPEPGQRVMGSAVDTAWRTYSWSNAMPVQGLHELISDNPWDGDPAALMFGTLTLPGTNSVDNVRLRGHTYAVSAGPHRTTLARDGRTHVRL